MMDPYSYQAQSDKDSQPQLLPGAEIRARQIAYLFNNAHVNLIATISTAILLVSLLQAHQPHSIQIIWLAVVFITTVYRFSLNFLYFRTAVKHPDEEEKWLVWFNLGVFISGLCWGLGGILLPPADTGMYMPFILLFLGSLLIASVIAYSMVVSSFLLFSLPLMIPVVYSLLINGDSVNSIIGYAAIILHALMYLYALRSNKAGVKMIELQLANTQLITDLSNEKKQISLLNNELEKRNREVIDNNIELESIVENRTRHLIESEERYRLLVETMSEGMGVMEGKGNLTYVNNSLCKMMGVTREELIGKPITDFVDDTNMEILKTRMKDREMGKHEPYEITWTVYGKKIDTIMTPSPLMDKDGNITGSFATVTDITLRKQAEEELQKLTHAVESSSSVVIMIDADGNIEYVNNKFQEITGYLKHEVIGEPLHFLQSGDTSTESYAELWNTITAGKEWRGELHNMRKDGTLYWSRASISGVKNARGEHTHYIAIEEDITREYELSTQLSYQASHDLLTGLINRYEFERRLERLITSVKHEETVHALCFMDLDQFKIVNDTCGHTAGDELLRQLGQTLQGVVRKHDTLARLGGDEFGVLMEYCSLEHAQRVATTLQQTVQDFQFLWEDRTFKIGVSIGLVPITPDVMNMTELLKHADAACYMAKDLGRNRVHVFDTEDSDLVRRHGEMQWVARIHQALDEDLFCLYAQPIVALDNKATDLMHYELLIRMKSDDGKLIPPGAFLPAAERYNIMSRLDRWVIEAAFNTLVNKPEHLKKLDFFSINLSGQSLTEKDLIDYVISLLESTGIDGEKICFEITETAAISNLTLASRFIHEMKAKGCRFALDDFGSGLSSFGYLKTLPVDYLKIDGMFVKDIVDDPIDYSMVKSINEIGQVMGMQTIAEFVENDDIKKLLNNIGVNYVQGNGIGEPQSLDDILQF